MPPVKPKAAAKVKEAADAAEAASSHIGAQLCSAREQRNMSVEDVADELMIRRFYLDALEQGNFKDLPERVYATGFVRAYAQLMEMDVQGALEQFKRDAYGSRNGGYRVELTMPEPIVQNVMPSRTALLSAAAAVIVVAIGIFLATRDSKPTTSAIPAPPVAADISEAPVAPAVPVPQAFEASPAASAVPAAPAPVVEKAYFLEALQNAWLEVKDAQGTVLYSDTLKQGQKLPLPNQEGLVLSTGNAGGLRLLVNDQPQGTLGRVNEVKRNTPLVLDKR